MSRKPLHGAEPGDSVRVVGRRKVCRWKGAARVVAAPGATGGAWEMEGSDGERFTVDRDCAEGRCGCGDGEFRL